MLLKVEGRGKRQNITMQRLVEATRRHIASHLQRKASLWTAEDKRKLPCHEGKALGWAVTGLQSHSPAVGVTPLDKEMPIQLLSLPLLSRATLCMVWTCKNGTRSHLSPLDIKAYPHSLRSYISTGFHLSRGILTRFRTQVTFFIPWQHFRYKPTPTFLQKAQSFIKNLRDDYSSHLSLHLLRMHMVWHRLVWAEDCTVFCKL